MSTLFFMMEVCLVRCLTIVLFGGSLTSESLMQKATKGLVWSYASTGTNALLNILIAAIMARLLSPAAFGLFAMAQVGVRFGQYFSQMGIGSALVQKQDLSKRDIGTAWFLILIICFAVFGIVWGAAPLISLYFKSGELTPILRVTAVTLVLQAAASIPFALLRRDMDFRVYSIIEISSYALGYGAVGIGCALSGLGVWSLVWAQVGQSTLQLIVAWSIVRCSLIPCWDRECVKHLFSYGGRVSVVSYLEFFSGSLDTLLAGRFLGKEILGFFNRGKMLSMLPLYSVSNSLGRVVFSLLSRLNDDEVRQRDVFLKGFFALSVVLIPAAAALSALAPMFVRVLLGPNWDMVVPVARICAYAVLLDLLANPLAILCEAQARLNRKIFIQFVRIVGMILLFWLLRDKGIEGIAYATLICQALVFVSYLVAVNHFARFSTLLSAMVPGVVIALFASVGAYVPEWGLNGSQYIIWSLQFCGFVICAITCLYSPPFKKVREDIEAYARSTFARLAS